MLVVDMISRTKLGFLGVGVVVVAVAAGVGTWIATTSPEEASTTEKSMSVKNTQTTERTLHSTTLSTTESTTSTTEPPTTTTEFVVVCENPEEEFGCKTGDCIPLEQRCDGKEDCADGSDEHRKECTECDPMTYYQCETTGECIFIEMQCDGYEDCEDGSDEREGHCKDCGFMRYRCDNEYFCLHNMLICDGYPDCYEAQDEMHCAERQCEHEHLFRCNTGYCISKTNQCDGVYHCTDRSDESIELCGCLDGSSHFRCNNNDCIMKYMVCDGKSDCSDGSDEHNCKYKECDPLTEVKCVDQNACLPIGDQCNGEDDCWSGSDEQQCEDCGYMRYRCNDGTCIDLMKTCDGVQDCDSDELNCATNDCRYSHLFKCEGSGQCISSTAVCDHEGDCAGHEDEQPQLCGCEKTSYRCTKPDKCIPSGFVCDGKNECEDGADEMLCEEKISSTTCEEGWTRFRTECFSYFETAGSWDLAKKWCSEQGATIATIHDQQENYVVKQVIASAETDVWIGLSVKDHTDTSSWSWADFTDFKFHNWDEGQPITNNKEYCAYMSAGTGVWKTSACGSLMGYVCKKLSGCDEKKEFACKDGTCILFEKQCDGTPDCSDASDEDENHCKDCGYLQSRCSSGNCITYDRICNGITDCDDGVDEQACEDRACEYDFLHRCSNGQCIDESLVCDGVPHCTDDESMEFCKVKPCLDEWTQMEDSCVKYFDSLLHFGGANVECASKSANMISIHSQEQQDLVKSLIPNSGDAWIGLNNGDRIPDGAWVWVDGTPTDFTIFGDGTPYNKEYCAYISNSKDGKWYKSRCATQFGYVCQMPARVTEVSTPAAEASFDAECGSGWWFSAGVCWQLVGTASHFGGGVAGCDALGGSLASIHSQQELDAINAVVADSPIDVWIGLNVAGRTADDPWVWYDESDATFTQWDVGQPITSNKEYCGFLSISSGMWRSSRCASAFAYLCRKLPTL